MDDRRPLYRPLTLQHDSTPRDAESLKFDPSGGDPFREARRRNYHNRGFESTSGDQDDGDEARHFGRKTHFVTSGVNSESKPSGALLYGSEPGGVALTYAAAVTLREKTSADIRKRERAIKEIEYDKSLRKGMEMVERQRRDEEKRNDLEMLQKHNPWGKPGGGAPLVDSSGGIYTRNAFKEVTKSPDEFYDRFGRPGAGAPIRSKSGHIMTAIKGDPDTRFQPSFKKDIESGLRYREDSNSKRDYARSLESQVKIQSELHARERELGQCRDAEMREYQPFGRPGAGAPVRDGKGNVVASLKTTSSTSLVPPDQKSTYRQKLDFQCQERGVSYRPAASQQFDVYDPWGKGSGVPQRDTGGNVKRHLHSDRNFIRDSLTSEKSPNDSNRSVAKIRHTLSTNVWDFPSSEKEEGFPFGGSNERHRKGGLRPRIQQEPEEVLLKKSLERKEYLEELRQDMEMRQRQKEAIKKKEPKEALEIVDWLGQGRTGQPRRDPTTGRLLPSQHRTTSDITTQRLDIRRPDPRESLEYHRELDAHLEVKLQREKEQKSNGNRIVSGKFITSKEASLGRILEQKSKYGEELLKSQHEKEKEWVNERSREQSAERRHAEAYNSLWGRQGAGAPRRDDQGRIVAHRNYKGLQEDSHRTDAIRL